jgi:hypothetical protein
LSLLLALSTAACDETDAVAVRIKLAPDLSGTLTASGLAQSAAESPMQQQTRGAQWNSRVEVIAAAGQFTHLKELELADVTFNAGHAEDHLGFVRVRIPRGPEVSWPKALVPLSPEERTRAAAALDPSGRMKDVGATVKFEIELPAEVIGNGVMARSRGTKNKSEGAIASIVIPLDAALSEGDPMIWHLTWQR